MRDRVGLVLGLLAMAAMGLAQDPASSAAASPATLRIPDVFHVVGVPGLGRDEKITLILDDTGLAYEKKKKAGPVVAYERVRRAEIVSGERQSGPYVVGPGDMGTATALASLVFAKKRKLDVLVLDFVNERGGRMGLVLQLPLGKGAACRDWLARHGVAVTEPEIERKK
jgi:hypothetical protein